MTESVPGVPDDRIRPHPDGPMLPTDPPPIEESPEQHAEELEERPQIEGRFV